MSAPAQILSVCSSADARIEVTYVVGENVLHTNQTEQGGWAPWRILDQGSHLSQVQSALDGDGRLTVGWLKNGQIWVSYANQPNGDLSNAIGLDTDALQQIVLLTDLDGRLEFLALSKKNELWSIAQNQAGSWESIGIYNLGGTELQQIAGTRYGDGRLTGVALGKDKKAYRIEQNGPGSGWGAWMGLAGTDIQGVAAAENADGDLVVAATGGNGILYYLTQPVGSDPSQWLTLTNAATKLVLPPQLARNEDGHLEVFATDNDSFIYHTYQDRPNGGWETPAVLVEPDTNVQFPWFCVTTLTNGRVVILLQPENLCGVSVYVQPRLNAKTLSLVTGPGTPCSPKIISFKANPRTAPYGTISTLTWDVEDEAGYCPSYVITISGELADGSVENLGPEPPETTFNPTGDSALWQIRGEAKITLSANCAGSPFPPVTKTITVNTNNVSAPPSEVVLQMALQLDPVSPPEGINFQAKVTVTNMGNEASILCDVYATDNGADAGTMPCPAIPPGSQKVVTFNFTAPSDGNFTTLVFTIPAYPATPPVGTTFPS